MDIVNFSIAMFVYQLLKATNVDGKASFFFE